MAKAAKPARRKTAKKQRKVVRKTKKLGEFRRLIRAAIKKPSRKRDRPLKQTSLVAKKLAELNALLLGPLPANFAVYGRLPVGVSSRLDHDVLAHRAREERADMVADGIIQPPRKAKRTKISAKKPRRVKQQVAPTAVGLSTLRLVHDGVAIVKRKVRHEQQEQASIRAWKGVYPKAVVEVERKVA